MWSLDRGGTHVTAEQDQPALLLTFGRRLFVLITVLVASSSFNAATFAVAAILPQVQGALAATQDEVSWTVTFNILATAVTMPMTGWLVNRFGRGSVQFWSLAGFTLATIMCGFSNSLEELVLWRLVQGATHRRRPFEAAADPAGFLGAHANVLGAKQH